MLPSKLNLTGRSLDDIQREFKVFIMRIQDMENREISVSEKEHFNADVNGWINYFESLKK